VPDAAKDGAIAGAANRGMELNLAAHCMELCMELTAVQSVDLSSLWIHQKRVVVACQMDDRMEDWREVHGRYPALAIEQLTCNMNQEEPWE
jgi:hypothetical protein